MSLRPIDFIGAIFNIQRAEKVQSNKAEHNLVLQHHISKEIEKQKREERSKVVHVEEGTGVRISDNTKKERKKEGGYERNMRRKKKGEGEIIDVEV